MTELLPIYELAQAQSTILKRSAPDDYELSAAALERNRAIFGEPLQAEEAVRRILQSVRQNGDTAVIDWTARIDGVQLEDLRVPEAEIAAALERIPADLMDALRQSAERVRRFHQNQRDRLQDWENDGLGQLICPIARVGCYVPGGTAPLPSSLIMTVVPAQVAGVSEVVVATPPSKDGSVPDVILAAAAICGVTTLYRIGGAQAIGALTYGTDQVQAVDKIVGPGNLYVTLAKRQVYGIVGIDGLPGPTETMVIADEKANAALIAADLLAQAEHDVLASAILITPSRPLAEKVVIEVSKQLENLSRDQIIVQSMSTRGGVVITANLVQAFEVANAYGAEHLCLAVENPRAWIDKVQNAGGIFLGENSFEVLGDYIAGPSHVMPTSGTARFASPLNILDFIKITSLIALDDVVAASLSPIAAQIAHAESLDGHAAAAEARTKETSR